MNFNDVKLAIKLIIDSDEVPLIIGKSGVGKTSLVREIAKEEGNNLIVIDANLLKEGEIGGLPTVEEFQSKVNGKVVTRKRTIYAIHTKLNEIEEILKENKNSKIILFIDELNRCDHNVQQELMNIILNKEINGYKVPSSVKMVAAMNPSSKYLGYEEVDYEVVDMDEAQENRFVWIELEEDIKSFLNYGFKKGLNEKVLEFLSTFPEMLFSKKNDDFISATPRSWERVCKILSNNEDILESNKNIIFNIIKGSVGSTIAQELLSFIRENKKSLLKPEEIFKRLDIEEIKFKVISEGHSRLYLIAKNCINYLSESEIVSEDDISRFSKVLSVYPVDLKIGIMKELKNNYEAIYKEFIKSDEFVESYFAHLAE